MTISTRSQTSAAVSASKKRKIENIDGPTEVVATDVGERVEELWFEEGNVIISASGLAYKVHSGVLSLHSTVFRDLLGGPALASLPETSDGCPVLRTDDRAWPFMKVAFVLFLHTKSHFPN